MSGRSKCTFLLVAQDGTAAPTFVVTRADYVNFLFHWVEWIRPNVLGSNAVLSNNITGQYQIGNYAPIDRSIFLNPLKTTTDST